MPRVAVLTVSKRTGWETLASESILRQTFWPHQWIVVTESQEHAIWNGGEPKPTVVPAPPQKRISNLNASLNRGLQFMGPKTDYVIFYQDFIELQPDCFEKLLALAAPDTFVTTCTPNYDGSDDGRYTGVDMPRPCRPEEWEANVAIAPMGIIRELGGFDEEYDDGWSWDNVNLAERAAMLGCKFILDESNRPKLLPHDKPSETMQLNAAFHEVRMAQIRAGEYPLKLPYLRTT